MDQYVERPEFLRNALRKSFDGPVDAQVCSVHQHRTSSLPANLGNRLQPFLISSNQTYRAAI